MAANFQVIKQSIATGETSRAIELLLEAIKQFPAGTQKEIVLLAARYEQWRKEERLGIANPQALTEINAALLDFIHDETEDDMDVQVVFFSKSLKKRQRNRRVLGILIVCLLGISLGAIYFNKKETPSASVEEGASTAAQSKEKAADWKPTMSSWYMQIPPFGVRCQLTIRGITAEAKDPTHQYLTIRLAVKNVHEGWHEAQLFSDLFLMREGEDATRTESDLSVISVQPGETKEVELLFSISNAAKDVHFLVRGSESKITEIPLNKD
ncbi:MAG TPA: hypothetical protein PKA00_21115 [Saprospiraceae bacterium]|nr:hypothetical protein [Saprospiraceae bacterium]HMQ85424.1 hypothetical protein [Saprospiraceae bacterium]